MNRIMMNNAMDSLHEQMLTMGALCERGIDEVLSAIAHPDRELADQVIARDDQIDDMERRIEAQCLTILARFSPVAVDLRAVTAAMGIISDLVGKREVDEWLDADGLRPYFKTVQQSSITYVRKPGPAIYYYAMDEVGARAENCCYVGDNLNRDIVGAKACDFGMTVAVQYNKNKPLKLTEENMPSAKIYTFPQLLDIFPACGQVAVEKLIAPTDGQ